MKHYQAEGQAPESKALVSNFLSLNSLILDEAPRDQIPEAPESSFLDYITREVRTAFHVGPKLCVRLTQIDSFQ